MSRGEIQYARRWRLLEMLHQYHEISIREIQDDPKASAGKGTIYQDIRALVSLGLADAVPGGIRARTRATWANTYFGRNYESLVEETLESLRRQESGGERRLLARWFAKHFGAPYQTAAIGNGTTCLAAAEELSTAYTGVTMVTNNLAIAHFMRHQLVLLIGGTVEPEVAATGGDFAREGLKSWTERHTVNIVVLSASGLVERPGDDGEMAYEVSCQWEAEKDSLNAMLSLGERPEVTLVLLMGQAKLGHQDLVTFGDLAKMGNRAGPTPNKVSILTSKMNADQRRCEWLDGLKERMEKNLPHVEMVFVPTASGGTNEGSER